MSAARGPEEQRRHERAKARQGQQKNADIPAQEQYAIGNEAFHGADQREGGAFCCVVGRVGLQEIVHGQMQRFKTQKEQRENSRDRQQLVCWEPRASRQQEDGEIQ